MIFIQNRKIIMLCIQWGNGNGSFRSNIIIVFRKKSRIDGTFFKNLICTVSKDLEKTIFPVSKTLSMETPQGAETTSTKVSLR